MYHLAIIWRRMGYTVHCLKDIDKIPSRCLLIPQIDLSVLPRRYRRVLALAYKAVNRKVFDIRKSTFSKIMVDENSSYDGPVIVKTDLNHGGMQELGLDGSLRSSRRDAASSKVHSGGYVVYKHKSEVPPAVFADPWFVVEKFVPEFDGEYHYLRTYSFFGEQHFWARLRSTSNLIISNKICGWEEIDVEPEIVDARRRMGFDFGKFDYVISDGVPVLLDANITPSCGYNDVLPVSSYIGKLADGIAAFLT